VYPDVAVRERGLDHGGAPLGPDLDLRPAGDEPRGRRRTGRSGASDCADAGRADAVVAEVARREDHGRAHGAGCAAHVVDRRRGEARERPSVAASEHLGATDEGSQWHLELDAVANDAPRAEVEERDGGPAPRTAVENPRRFEPLVAA
jgi:hypothetical protein